VCFNMCELMKMHRIVVYKECSKTFHFSWLGCGLCRARLLTRFCNGSLKHACMFEFTLALTVQQFVSLNNLACCLFEFYFGRIFNGTLKHFLKNDVLALIQSCLI